MIFSYEHIFFLRCEVWDKDVEQKGALPPSKSSIWSKKSAQKNMFSLKNIWPIFSILGYLNAFCCLFVAKLPLTFAKLNSIPLNRARGPMNIVWATIITILVMILSISQDGFVWKEATTNIPMDYIGLSSFSPFKYIKINISRSPMVSPIFREPHMIWSQSCQPPHARDHEPRLPRDGEASSSAAPGILRCRELFGVKKVVPTEVEWFNRHPQNGTNGSVSMAAFTDRPAPPTLCLH